MKKRPEVLDSALLLLELLQRIPRGRKVTAPALQSDLAAAGFKRSLRTIQRHLDVLSEHFDVDRDARSKPFGYSWKSSAKGLSLPSLTPQQSLILMLAEKQLGNLLPASLLKSMDGYFAQARMNLAPFSDARREREWLRKVRIVSETQPLLPPRLKPGVWDEVSNALYCDQWLDVDYGSASGKRTRANVMPLGLAQQGPRLYLVCRFEGYEAERSLALHRIQSARAIAREFERPAEFDLQKFDEDGQFGFGEGKWIRLSFKIDKDAGAHLRETPLSADQKMTVLGDEFKVIATVVDSARLDWWLSGFGERVCEVRKTRRAVH